MSGQTQDTRSQGPGTPKLQEVVTTLLAHKDESSARGRLAREPGLLGLVGADVLERHVAGGGDPIGAEVGLEGRGHEHRAVLLLIALQEGDEDTRDSTARGIHRVCELQLPSLGLEHDV